MSPARQVVLYGASGGGKYVLSRLGPQVRVIAFLDSDPAKHDGHFCGHPVLPPAAVRHLACDAVLVSTARFEEVREHLLALGVPAAKIEPALASYAAPPAPLPPAANPIAPARVSVVMPVYNRVGTVARAIASVRAQSYGDWELLVVDDGSDDGTPARVAALAEGDARIRLLRGTHRGASAARNRGLAEATGTLIAYLDSDNRWHPDYLHYMSARFADPAFNCGYCGMNIIREPEGVVSVWTPAFDRDQLEQMNFIDLNAFMHRRELIETFGTFDEGLTRFIDWDLILRYTRERAPFFLRAVLADYYNDRRLARITDAEPFASNYDHLSARHGLNGEARR